jgi:hypothetical protein
MKTLIWAFTTILLFATSFVACDKNEGDLSIVGSWNMTSMKLDGAEEPDALVGITKIITFKDDGTWTARTTTSVDLGSGTYSISGNYLKIVELGETYHCTIESLTSSRLEIHWADYGYTAIFTRYIIN